MTRSPFLLVPITAALLLVGPAVTPAAGQAVPLDTAGVGQGPWARACMLLERTIFKVDVLTLELRLGAETSEEIRRLVGRGAGRDSVARAAMESRDAFARIEFLRDVGMDQFLDGVRQDLRRTVRAGLISPATFDDVSASLPRWYDFLEGRDVREGDRVLYRIRGDTLHSGYVSANGETLLSQTDVGAERRLAVLGSYLVEGSSFRDGLVRDLVGEDPGDC